MQVSFRADFREVKEFEKMGIRRRLPLVTTVQVLDLLFGCCNICDFIVYFAYVDYAQC
jgi:hypothetical protein